MAETTGIEWADHTASPWYGCSHAILTDGTEHPGCLNCYAERMAKRNPAVLGSWGTAGTRTVSQSFIENCRRWNKQAATSGRRTIVFPSICDPFEDFAGWVLDHQQAVQWHCRDCGIVETVKMDGHGCCCQVCGSGNGSAATLDDLRRELFALIDECPHLTFTLLTKRPQNVRRMWPWGWGTAATMPPHGTPVPHFPDGHLKPSKPALRKNVWLLTSVSDQQTADVMIPSLLECRDLVPVLGLSIEPLLGPVDLSRCLISRRGFFGNIESLECCGKTYSQRHGIDWVIVGGESGPNARPCHPDWVRSLRDQCQSVGVPFFFKQWGEWLPATIESADTNVLLDGTQSDTDGTPMRRVGKKAAGRLFDGREWSEFPESSEQP